MYPLSVVIPVYNSEKYIEECVNSVLGQTFTDFELIIVDDGSTDGSPALCEKFRRRDDRVKILHRENGGVFSARARGVAAAEGEYICFADADDRLMPDMLKTLVGKIGEYRADMVQCGVLVDGKKTDKNLTSPCTRVFENPAQELLAPFYQDSCSLYPVTNAVWNKIYKREILASVCKENFARGLSMGEDLILNLQYLFSCRRVVVLGGENLYCYRTNSLSLTNRYTVKKRENTLRMYDLLEELGKKQGFRVLSAGRARDISCVQLMLDAALSDMTTEEKKREINFLKKEIRDKSAYKKAARNMSAGGKLAVGLISLFGKGE